MITFQVNFGRLIRNGLKKLRILDSLITWVGIIPLDEVKGQ
jgi:hypothetical protein